MKNLVSIIIPCYNGAKTIGRCLDSILMQDYTPLEVIVVNDGSKDESSTVVEGYKDKFASNKMELLLINQENKGLAGAINAGLLKFTGDYLCWIDCDDYLLEHSIKKRVDFLNENPDIAVVTSDAYFYDENDLSTPVKRASDGMLDLMNPYQFENHLRSKAIFCCGCHMVRSSAFIDTVPTRQIYPARRGQNWQMLLPVYYKYKQAFLNDPLYAYILYSTSMSTGDITKGDYLLRYNEYLEIITETLLSIDMSQKERRKYMNIYHGIYHRQLFYLGVSFHDYKMILSNMMKMICYAEFKISDIMWMLKLMIKRVVKVG